MHTAVGKKLLGLVIGVLAMTLAFAPASYAGEDDDDDSATTTKRVSSSGSGDSGSASGGVAAGVGGMAVAPDQNLFVPALLTGGGILVLTAAGGIALRRRGDLQVTHGVGG